MPPKASNNAGNRSLPKFGEWDVNNPQSAEGFTVIFNTARDQKKNDRSNSGNSAGGNQRPNQNNQGNQRQHHKQNDQQHNSTKKKWLSCLFGK
ncbi:protein NOI4 [Spinacia oleracea]|uniref:Protein NOI4 n=1 Tax=Spinacia oleracea TaxID=3562 RepID=A0A9R0J185_SPIOL|nr:protein NOI4-like [Spinacia oleracea]